ncbi:MAG TPA: SBBP repeat-containing protein, partial [Candidatus Binatia bacterium]|nr:SBBP repeat-containing protein [Candidatus Binatia bacterium]
TPSALAIDAQGNIYVTGTSSGVSDTGLDFVLVKYTQNLVTGLPTITSVPQGAVIAYGSNFTFTVAALGEEPLWYQWRFDGQDIPGATNNTFVISPAGFEQSGSYSVQVANAHGRVISPDAVLVVQAPPSIVVQPQSQIVAAGSTVSFSVVVEGSTPLFHQWFLNGVPITNAVQRTLVLRNVHPGLAGTYSVLTTNRAGALQSSPARLVVSTLAQQSWDRQYNGPLGSSDDAQAIAVGPDGSVFVTGLSIGVGGDYATVKYDANGSEVWVARYNGPVDGNDFPTAIAVDGAGNAYVTGRSWGGASALDIATVKYDANGSEVWVARFNSPDNLNDSGSAIAVDTSGNVYVTGSSVVAPDNSDFITIKYDASGAQLWTHRYDGPAHGYDEAFALAVDSDGRAYVTGTSSQDSFNTDIATIKYETDGTPLWIARYNGPANSHDTAKKVRLDQAGNVYVAGDTYASNNYPDYALVKYSAAGTRLWAARYDNPDHLYDYVSDLIVDPAGYAYVTGTTHPLGQASSYLTIKYGPNGERLWMAGFTGQYDGSDAPGALTFDATGNICVVGTVHNGETFDIATVCYDTTGHRRWTAIYAGSGTSIDTSIGLGADQSGNVFVAGTSVAGGESDFVTLKYSQGNFTGTPRINTPPHDQLVPLGETTQFSVSAVGATPLTYRWWFKNRVIAEGDSFSSLSLSNVNESMAGYYSAEVFNSLGSLVSPLAELRLTGPVIPRFSYVGLTNGSLRIVIQAQGGFMYRLDASPDLINWWPGATNFNQNSSIEFLEPVAGAPRYYRAVKLQ